MHDVTFYTYLNNNNTKDVGWFNEGDHSIRGGDSIDLFRGKLLTGCPCTTGWIKPQHLCGRSFLHRDPIEQLCLAKIAIVSCSPATLHFCCCSLVGLMSRWIGEHEFKITSYSSVIYRECHFELVKVDTYIGRWFTEFPLPQCYIPVYLYYCRATLKWSDPTFNRLKLIMFILTAGDFLSRGLI